MVDATVPSRTLPPNVEERFVEAGGVTFRYLRGGTPQGSGSPTPILFLHGYPAWAEVWLPLADALGAGHPWIAPDLPCHNRSLPLPGKDRSLSAYRRAVVALLDALALPRVIVVGSSMGGTLAVMLAIDRPTQVEKLVLVDAAGLVPKLPAKALRLYLPVLLPAYLRAPSAHGMTSLLQKAVFHDPRFADADWVNTLVEQWRPRDQRLAYLATGQALRRSDASVAADLGRIECPTLLVWGLQDPQFDWHIGENAARQIRHARFVPIEDAGHFPMVEKPAETATAISAFLDT
ncbi:MAG TPA: alpha/beta fold hydrolase [Thermoplasmata archaeon]|nr:alpha/beta fold hydrolase [Thermoplasmata archaeon]